MVTQPARSSRVCTSLTNIAPLPYHRILRRCHCMSPVLAVAQPSGFSEQPPSDSQRFGSVSATLNSYRTGSMQQNEFEFQNRRGQNLLGVEFLPETEQQQWATLIWHHGVCEHSGRYIPGTAVQHVASHHASCYLTMHMRCTRQANELPMLSCSVQPYGQSRSCGVHV